MSFVRAERRKAKARILLAGPSGAGKSYSALLLAKGLCGRVAAIDTEHGSLANYDNLIDFDVDNMGAPFGPQAYIQRINEAQRAGYDVLIIDSITHEWSSPGGILDLKDKMPGANDYTKWGKLTPMHDAFIQAMLQCDMHVIATVRSKTAYTLEDRDGKAVPKKIGQAPQQRDGMEYEFTTVFDLQVDSNVASAAKDRTGLFRQSYEVITEETGKRIKAWLEGGSDAPVAAAPAVKAAAPAVKAETNGHNGQTVPDPALKDARNACRHLAKALSLDEDQFTAEISSFGDSLNDLDECGLINLSAHLESLLPKDEDQGNGSEAPQSVPETTSQETSQESESESEPQSAASEIGLNSNGTPLFKSKAEAVRAVKEMFEARGLTEVAQQAEWFRVHQYTAAPVAAQQIVNLERAYVELHSVEAVTL